MLAVLSLMVGTVALTQELDARDSWTEDVLHLVEKIERMHPRPFFACPEEEFERGVDAFLATVAHADEPHALTAFMRLVAMLSREGREGHSGAWPLDASYLPLRFYDFADGWIVVDAEAEWRDWIGAELVSVGGLPVETACERLAPLLTCDNEWNRKVKLAQALACADVLVGADLAKATDRVRVELRRGAEGEEIELPTVRRNLYDLWSGFNLPSRPGVSWLEGREQAFRLQVLEPEHALYVQYNEVTSRASDGKRLSDFAAELVRTFEDQHLTRVIVDVRSNRGGDNTTFGPMISALETPAINKPGVLFGLIGRETFSAAGNFTTVLERETHAILVGEPTGGAPNQYGDALPVPLPHHPNVLVQVATRYHQFGKADDARLTHEPHLPVPLRSSDYLDGRDPVLRAALDYAPPR